VAAVLRTQSYHPIAGLTRFLLLCKKQMSVLCDPQWQRLANGLAEMRSLSHVQKCPSRVHNAMACVDVLFSGANWHFKEHHRAWSTARPQKSGGCKRGEGSRSRICHVWRAPKK
jgi:hypothetical protein